jgi:hypothetical protein
MKPLLLITAAHLALAVFGQLDTGDPPHVHDTQWLRLAPPNPGAAGPTLPLFPASASYFLQEVESSALGKAQGGHNTPIVGRLSETAGTQLPLFPETPINYIIRR